MEIYGIDSHKLNLHPDRVAKWLDGEDIYPIYMELSPSGACNHRCSFCTMDFMGYRANFLDTAITKKRLAECGRLGVKAIMFAGEGEPLLHKDICELAETAKASGIDVAFTTNAVLLDKKRAHRLLPVSSWIKVSCNAGTADSYGKIHGTKAEDYHTVLRNMEEAVKIRKEENLSCTLGFQCILLPESRPDMVEHARRVRDLGADYLVIKPYTHNPASLKERREIVYDDTETLAIALEAIETDSFKIIFRSNAMQRWNEKDVNFTKCHALPFWAYVDAEANVWGCLRHLKEDAFSYGNLYEKSFEDIWTGEQRKKNMQWCDEKLDISECHITCRMEMINTYLQQLKTPSSHDNFI